MPLFRKKPVVIDAVLWTGYNKADMMHFLGPDRNGEVVPRRDDKTYLEIITLEGVMTASPGDYIIRGVKGELYPCKADIFEATYEAV